MKRTFLRVKFRNHREFFQSVETCRASRLRCSRFLSAMAQTSDKETVGRHENGRIVLPVNQVITPTGKQVELPGMRAEALACRRMASC